MTTKQPTNRSNRPTKKEMAFAREFVKTGNGVKSALKAYDTSNYHTAGVMANENLNKPKIQNLIKSIAESIPDSLVTQKHNELLTQKRIDYLLFPKHMEDGEIIEHMEAAGLATITVRPSDVGKMAFYSTNDVQAIKAGLDMSYKIKGTYAPQRMRHSGSIRLGQLESLTNDELARLAEEAGRGDGEEDTG